MTALKRHSGRRYKILFFILGAIIALLAIYEKYPAVERRIRQHQGPAWSSVSTDYVVAVRSVSAHELSYNKGIPPVSCDNISRTEANFRSIFHEKRHNSWPNTLQAMGILEHYRSFHDEEDLRLLNDWLQHVARAIQSGQENIETVDACMVGWIMLKLNNLTGRPDYRAELSQIGQFLLHDHVRSSTDVLPYRSKSPDLCYVDTIGMVCPVLSLLSEEGLTLSVNQLKDFLENGMDEQTSLPYHAYDSRSKNRLGIIGWLRGTGWLLMGLTETLIQLPPDHPDYPYLQQWLVRIAEAVTDYQSDEGCWGWAILLPGCPADTSGTAMIAYSMERAANAGLLTENCRDAVTQAMAGVTACTSPQGYVQQSQAEIRIISVYPVTFCHAAWGQGPALALASLIHQRNDF